MEETDPPINVAGYNQTYVVFNEEKEAENDHRKVIFVCGNWSYSGVASFPNMSISLNTIPQVSYTNNSLFLLLVKLPVKYLKDIEKNAFVD